MGVKIPGDEGRPGVFVDTGPLNNNNGQPTRCPVEGRSPAKSIAGSDPLPGGQVSGRHSGNEGDAGGLMIPSPGKSGGELHSSARHESRGAHQTARPSWRVWRSSAVSSTSRHTLDNGWDRTHPGVLVGRTLLKGESHTPRPYPGRGCVTAFPQGYQKKKKRRGYLLTHPCMSSSLPSYYAILRG